MEEQEQERNFNAFGGQTVGAAVAISFQQTVPFALTQIVAGLVEA